jgi:sarcosine oxidase
VSTIPTGRYDVIVVGLGAVGAATARALARAGARVLGLDQLAPPHAAGSSHGDTRITRLAVGEGAQYGPLVRRSHELWRELEAETGESLYVACGGLIMGVAGASDHHRVDDFVRSTVDVAVANGVDHEVLTTEQIRSRFPAFAVTSEVGYYEPTAGYLRAEACVSAQLASARRHGATILVNEAVQTWRAEPTVSVTTTRATYEAGAIVLAAGPWMAELVPMFSPAFAVYRQVQYWFDVRRHFDTFADGPVFIWLHGAATGQFLYGFPAVDGPRGGVKLATETFDEPTTPETVDRAVTAREADAMYDEHVARQFPDLDRRVVRSRVCLYTVTPDFHFLIDRHPGIDSVVVASSCSGHGFKHAPAVGELAAALAMGVTPLVANDPFSFARFARGVDAQPDR